MTLPFTRAAWRPLCSAAVLGAALWAAGASAAERRFDLPAQPLAASLSRLAAPGRGPGGGGGPRRGGGGGPGG
ncbi:hypothetical protein OFL47_07495, partial [Pseudomonas aeruginosa]|uniref:hypothetical protein n=1 Tax=Pseudomonas aeruginosa TaxID=287 RepID=UPI0021F12CE2